MDYLSWDLSILSRAVAYSNLSSASSHVGLSQPQLSRIVAKLEDQLGLVLLDRETKRKSSWTPAAFKLAEVYTQTYHQFRLSVGQLVEGMEPDHFRIATLEGLVNRALNFARMLYKHTDIKTIELNVYDTNILEEKFFKNELDLIFSAREPGMKKFRYRKNLGWQTLEIEKKGEPLVYSSFEFSSKPKQTSAQRMFVSNSLKIRKDFMELEGGTGSTPSEIKAKKTGKKNEVPVLAIAHDHLSPGFWSKIEPHL